MSSGAIEWNASNGGRGHWLAVGQFLTDLLGPCLAKHPVILCEKGPILKFAGRP